MSFHEWNDVMYGIELPNTFISEDKLLAFVTKYKDVFTQFVDDDVIPTTPDSVYEFVDEYEDDCGYTGIGVLLTDVIGCRFITSTHDQYGNSYIGIYAVDMLPWRIDQMSELWKSLTPKYIECKIRPVIEELFGECPEFREHTIWNCG